MHAGGSPVELARCLGRLRELRNEYGRDGEPFEIHASSLEAYTGDGVRRLQEQGITDLVVGFRMPYEKSRDTQPLQSKIDALQRYADSVIAKL